MQLSTHLCIAHTTIPYIAPAPSVICDPNEQCNVDCSTITGRCEGLIVDATAASSVRVINCIGEIEGLDIYCPKFNGVIQGDNTCRLNGTCEIKDLQIYAQNGFNQFQVADSINVSDSGCCPLPRMRCGPYPETATGNAFRCVFGNDGDPKISNNACLTNDGDPNPSHTCNDYVMTQFPTPEPTITPTNNPSFSPSIPTADPSEQPSSNPTINPTHLPTSNPTGNPTAEPSNRPTSPTSNPVVSDMINANTPTFSPVYNEDVFNPSVSPSMASMKHDGSGDQRMDSQTLIIIILASALGLCCFVGVLLLGIWIGKRSNQQHTKTTNTTTGHLVNVGSVSSIEIKENKDYRNVVTAVSVSVSSADALPESKGTIMDPNTRTQEMVKTLHTDYDNGDDSVEQMFDGDLEGHGHQQDITEGNLKQSVVDIVTQDGKGYVKDVNNNNTEDSDHNVEEMFDAHDNDDVMTPRETTKGHSYALPQPRTKNQWI